MKTQILLTSVVFLFAAASVFAQTRTFDFDKNKAGETPPGFSTALTGQGKAGVWTKADSVTYFDELKVVEQ